jgi:hypothetical protein
MNAEPQSAKPGAFSSAESLGGGFGVSSASNGRSFIESRRQFADSVADGRALKKDINNVELVWSLSGQRCNESQLLAICC